jgi:predicted acyltransferase
MAEAKAAAAAPSAAKKRLDSLDAFRGFTIFGMIFVIAVAAGGYWKEAKELPQTMQWFGSLPISTWFHAEVGYDRWELNFKEQQTNALTTDASFAPGLAEAERATAVATEVTARIEAAPERKLRGIGVTFTDLIAPWFVFIVGAVIPIGRRRESGEYYRHAAWRTFMLILAGVIYIALVIKQISWWWGVLQAIGVAYLCAAITARQTPMVQWLAVLGLGGLNLALTEHFPAWTKPVGGTAPFGTLTNPNGDWLRPFNIHCLPWLSLSYGVMAMIGVLVGQALATKETRRIVQQSLIVGVGFTLLGWLIHRVGFATENYSLCMNKPIVTTSYAFFTAGLGAITFLGFYYVIDVLGYKSWAWPLNVFGMNALLAYFLQVIMRRGFESLGIVDAFNRVGPTNAFVSNWAQYFGSATEPAHWVLDLFSKGGWMGMFWGLLWTACLWAIVLYCNRREIFWKL